MTTWSDDARATIEAVAATLPDKMTLKARRAAIDAAYPFGPRSNWPVKAWRKALREYLSRFDRNGVRIGRPDALTGLEHLPRDPVTGRPVI